MTESAWSRLQRVFDVRVDATDADLRAAVVSQLGHRSLLDRPADPRTVAARVHLAPDAVIIGPWGGGAPDQPCGQCLGRRWQRLRGRTQREALEHGADPVPVGDWPRLTPFAVDAAWELYRQVFDPARRPAGSAFGADWQRPADLELAQVSRLDLDSLSVLTVPLMADPLCPGCQSGGETVEPGPLELVGRPKKTPTRFRTRDLEDYSLPTGALANPVTGVLGLGTWVNLTSPTTAPVAGSIFMRGHAGLSDVTWSGQANSYNTSRRLAFMEGLERYAGTHRRDLQSPVVAAYSELGDRALDPRSCGSYSARTYREDGFVDPFDPDRKIPWVWGHSLRDDRPVLVPTRLVYYSAGVDEDNFVFECSNGCATGGSLEEAILFGLLELVERDSFLLGWYGGATLTELDLSTCHRSDVQFMISRADLLGYEVHAFDNRIDLDIPVVTTLAVRRDGGPGTYSFAAGASLDVDAAIESALSETLTYIPHLAGQVNAGREELSAMVNDFDRVVHLSDHARLFGMPEMTRHVRRYLEPTRVSGLTDSFAPAGRRTDLLDDLAHVRDQLVQAGHDVIVVDQTAPEQTAMGLSTVGMIVPGLLPIDFGWKRQRALTMPRLRTAFRRAGRCDRDLTPDEIVQVPHPFP